MLNHKIENLKPRKKVERVLPDGRAIVTFLKVRNIAPDKTEKYCVVLLLAPGYDKSKTIDKQDGIINTVEVHANGNGDIDWNTRNLSLLLDTVRDDSVEQIGI